MAVCFLRGVLARLHRSISFIEKSDGKGLEIMLTITDLIAVISLCATFYSLGYVRGKHDAKTEKDRPTLRK